VQIENFHAHFFAGYDVEMTVGTLLDDERFDNREWNSFFRVIFQSPEMLALIKKAKDIAEKTTEVTQEEISIFNWKQISTNYVSDSEYESDFSDGGSIRKRARTPWTQQQDDLLVELIPEFGCRISKIKGYLPGKSIACIRTRSKYLCEKHKELNPYLVKIRHVWSSQEDSNLIRLIEEYGDNNWKLIGKKMKNFGRSSDQCRTRYFPPKLTDC
jgi:hypothetical protein